MRADASTIAVIDCMLIGVLGVVEVIDDTKQTLLKTVRVGKMRKLRNEKLTMKVKKKMGGEERTFPRDFMLAL